MLNIDELIGKPKVIVFGGQYYEAKEPTLETMLKAQKLIEAGSANDELETMSKVVELMIPGFDVKHVPVKQLPAIFNYLMGSDSEKKTEAETVLPVN